MKDFNRIYNGLPSNGWLDRDEAELLWGSAQLTTGSILEVGCYHGRSTCLLAELGRPLFCVDPFKDFDSDDPTGTKIYEAWCRNLADRCIVCAIGMPAAGSWGGLEKCMKDNGWSTLVILHRKRIEEWKPRPVGFAYLDGDHTPVGTVNQLRAALECGAKSIGVHDVNDQGEGAKIKEVCLNVLGPWNHRVGRLAVWHLTGTHRRIP